MKKTGAKILALMLAAAMMLGGCAGGTQKPESDNKEAATQTTEQEQNKGTDKKEHKELKTVTLGKLASRELETFNFLQSQRAEDGENLTNLWEGLLTTNYKGQFLPQLATEWGTEDEGLTWTFKLRDDVTWVDVNGEIQAPCNGDDFATGLEWVLNFHKNDSANTSMPIEMIQGAEEYYEYTKTLDKEAAYALNGGEGSKFREMVGLAIPDETTLIYTCKTAKPYFDTLATHNSLYPLSQGLVDKLGVDGVKSMNNENMWYNGPYTMTTYVQGNEKIFTPNPNYWDKDCKLFESATFRMVESDDVTYHLYQNGEVDYVQLTESMVKTITENPNHEYHDYMVPARPDSFSYQFHWNYGKHNEDGTLDENWNTAISNEAFRRAIYYGLDFTEYFKRTNALDPISCENVCFTARHLVNTSEGRDYIELVKDRTGLKNGDGTKPVRYQPDLAKQYKEQAIEEMTALGVTFPVQIDHYIQSANQISLDSALVLKDTFSKCLGDDFVHLNIKTYVSSLKKEVREPRLQSFVINGWGADYSDPQNFLGQMTIGTDNAWYSVYNNINDVPETEATKDLLNYFRTFTEMVAEADTIADDMDKRYEAFADAEAYMLDHALVMPCNYRINWCLTRYNVHGDFSGNKMKNWETNADGYTVEEMNELIARQNEK
ncbi:MAG: ABC transporter substrate-binding protein [Negativibacillus sp.]|nr:ABC transporter substrate-binding protein [Negativibacillus sp.]